MQVDKVRYYMDVAFFKNDKKNNEQESYITYSTVKVKLLVKNKEVL